MLATESILHTHVFVIRPIWFAIIRFPCSSSCWTLKLFKITIGKFLARRSVPASAPTHASIFAVEWPYACWLYYGACRINCGWELKGVFVMWTGLRKPIPASRTPYSKLYHYSIAVRCNNHMTERTSCSSIVTPYHQQPEFILVFWS